VNISCLDGLLTEDSPNVIFSAQSCAGLNSKAQSFLLLTEISGALAPPRHSLAKLTNKRVGTKENFIVAAFDIKLSFSKL